MLLLCSEENISAEEKRVLEEKFNLVARFDLPDRGEKGFWKLIYNFVPIAATRLAHLFGSHKKHYESNGEAHAWMKEQIFSNRYDLIVCRYLMQPAQTGVLEFKPVIIDVDDLDSQKYESRLQSPGVGIIQKLILQLHLFKFNKITPQILAKANHLWFTNVDDLNRISAHEMSSVLPNIPLISSPINENITQEPVNSLNILSVCAMNFDVNERGIDRFLKYIWPRILKTVPRAVFVLVGADMTQRQIDNWMKYENVDVRGFVESLDDSYAECAFTVTPIFEGGGTKIKVAESLAYKRTCVVSSHAYRGYEEILKDGQSLLVAKNDKQFADYCIKLLNDHILRKNLAESGNESVLNKLSYTQFKQIVARTVEGLCS